MMVRVLVCLIQCCIQTAALSSLGDVGLDIRLILVGFTRELFPPVISG
jgi:hypothetical protein